MYTAITRSQLFVLDQDQALDFYVDKLGLEVSADIDLGFMRWLTVRVPGDPSREILLELPGPPSMDPATADQVRDVITKGAGGGWLSIATTDAVSVFETLKGRGVDITDEPSPKPYGIDFGIREPLRERHPHRSDVRPGGSLTRDPAMPAEKAPPPTNTPNKGPASYFPSIERTYGRPLRRIGRSAAAQPSDPGSSPAQRRSAPNGHPGTNRGVAAAYAE